MSFWSTDFMNDRRKQWLNALVKFQYLVNGTWYDATIRTSSGSQTIKAVRIIDVTGKQAGYQATEIVRAANQGVLTKFEFPIYEKEDET